MTPGAFVFILLTVVLTAAGQVLIKLQTMRSGSAPEGVGPMIAFAIGGLTSPAGVAGLTCALAAAVAWFLALSRLPLATAYPFMALNFCLVPLLGWAVFGERISLASGIGLVLIVAGLLLVGGAGVRAP